MCSIWLSSMKDHCPIQKDIVVQPTSDRNCSVQKRSRIQACPLYSSSTVQCCDWFGNLKIQTGYCQTTQHGMGLLKKILPLCSLSVFKIFKCDMTQLSDHVQETWKCSQWHHPGVRSGQIWKHTPEQRVAVSTLRRYSLGLRLHIAQADARTAMPESFR